MSFILNCDSEPRVYSDETTLPNYSFIYKRRAYITLDVNYLSYLKHLVSTAVIDTKSKTTSMQSSFETCRTQVRNFLGKGFLRNPRRRLEDSCEMHLASLAPPVTLLKPIDHSRSRCVVAAQRRNWRADSRCPRSEFRVEEKLKGEVTREVRNPLNEYNRRR